MLAEIAMRHRDTVLGKTSKSLLKNLRQLNRLYVRASRHYWLDFSTRRNDRFSMAAQRRNSRAFASRGRAGRPARTWRLFRRAFAISALVAAVGRKLPSPEPARELITSWSVIEDDNGITNGDFENAHSNWPATVFVLFFPDPPHTLPGLA